MRLASIDGAKVASRSQERVDKDATSLRAGFEAARDLAFWLLDATNQFSGLIPAR